MPSKVSLVMIVKNEATNLPTCLRSVADLVDEIIIVDTGSIDRTKEEAIAFGARVFDFVWRDDFAAARNECLRHATGTWIFWLDGDEWINEENRGRLRKLFAGLADENVGFVMEQRSPTQFFHLGVPDKRGEQLMEQVRLFRNHPLIRWQFRVFEQIRPAVRCAGGTVRKTEIVIEHLGYQDASSMRQKIERNLRLARLQDLDQPDDPYLQAHIGDLLSALGRAAEAIPFLQRSLERLPPTSPIRLRAYASLKRAYQERC